MTDRSDIQPSSNGWRRLSYTCRCGWVDWGHALPGSALELKRQIDNEKPSLGLLSKLKITFDGDPAYVVVYGQAMGSGMIRVSNVRHWIVKKGLSPIEREQAALGIFLSASYGFERMQGSFPFSLVSGRSSFSPEDLVSNLIGFYGAFKSIPQAQLRKTCGEVSVDESYRLWDAHLPEGLGALRNESTRPILVSSNECTSGIDSPALFSSITPAANGTSWVRLRNRFIDGHLVNAGRPINVDTRGIITARSPASVK